MGKWFGQASEIEELRTENRRLKEQVATLEARLRAAYADAGISALAGPSSPVASTDSLAPATASSLEVSDAEMELLATGPKIAAVKAYKDRTGVDLKTAKATIDAAR
nr:50S ribosomal protein L7/L12 [uncultured Actinomyces sp.]